jgi:DNA-binding GntR family transcriptional regulator
MSSASSRLIERSPGLSVRAHNAIRDLIVDGTFAPGDRLNEVDLSETFGISRAPVREALQRLASEGLVDLIPNRGAFVRQFTGDELRDLYEVRNTLEVAAAELAAARATGGDLAALFALLDETQDALAGADAGAYPPNLDFHRLVLEASGNSYLVKCGREVQVAVNLARARSGGAPGRAGEALDEHREIAQAIADGDGDRASAAMRRHLNHSFERASDVLPPQP